MDYSIIYSSGTGNTVILAEAIKEALPTQKCKYFGVSEGEEIQTKLVFAGFWTNQGTCDSSAKAFLKTLKNKDVFLFGTAGFGGNQEYYDKILDAVQENIGLSNKLIGTYMCQGKMGIAVREKYEKMLAEDSDNLNVQDMIDNFDRAATHPDLTDCEKLKQKVRALND